MNVLLSAYACRPDRGSESGLGWNWAKATARRYRTWVITASVNRPAIEAAGELPGASFVYVDEPMVGLRGTRVLQWIPYYLWQVAAYRRAVSLHRDVGFSLCHHVTLASWRVPSLLWRLPAPLVWGPVGGGQVAPSGFGRTLGPTGRGIEGVRRVFQAVSRHDPLVRATLRRAAVVLAANSPTKALLRAMGRADAEQLLETAAPDAMIAGPLPDAQRGSRLEVLWVGKFEPRKALPLLLDAIARLDGVTDAHLTVVGAGSEAARWRRAAHRLGVEHRVRFTGALPLTETLRLYRDADVFVFTSLRDTSGNVLLEAMAAGVPVVALDWAGTRDIVDESCAITVRPTSPDQVAGDLAAALSRLAADPALRRRLSEAGRRRVQERFTWQNLSDAMSCVYDRALAARAHRAALGPDASGGAPPAG